VKIRKNVGDNAETLGVFCGTKRPSPITSHGNTLLVEFTSDNTVQRTGFEAYFFTGKNSRHCIFSSTFSLSFLL